VVVCRDECRMKMREVIDDDVIEEMMIMHRAKTDGQG